MAIESSRFEAELYSHLDAPEFHIFVLMLARHAGNARALCDDCCLHSVGSYFFTNWYGT